MKKTLKVTTPHGTYLAVFEKETNWRLTRCDKSLLWLIHYPFNKLPEILTREEGWSYTWIDHSDEFEKLTPVFDHLFPK